MLKILNREKIIKYSVPLFTLAVISRSIEEISFLYYAVPLMCVFFIIILLFNAQFESNDRLTSSIINHPFTSFLFPGIWFLLTALWSSYPDVSALRALYFILISLGCISAGLLWISHSEKNILELLLPANIAAVLISSFSLLTSIPPDSWTGGHGKGFMGFFGHQNLLASVILFTIPSVFFKLFQLVKSDQLSVIRNTTQKKSSNYLLLSAYILLLVANLAILTLTYSRSALLSLIFGVLVFLILNRNWKVLSYSFAIILVSGIVIYFIPSINHFADKLIKKDFPEVYSSRLWLWEPSYKAALEGGLRGLGYGISHPEIRSGEFSDHFEKGRLIREKGNSALALIEETGVIGLTLFLIPIFMALNIFRIYNVEFRMKARTNYTFYIIYSSLAAILLHAQFEAWWVGVGSIQLPLYFIYLGMAFKMKLSDVIRS
jgi:hypothetical protein